MYLSMMLIKFTLLLKFKKTVLKFNAKWAQENDGTKILIITRLEREVNKSYSLAIEITQQVCELISSKLIV